METWVRVLVGFSSAMGTWVRAVLVLVRNGDGVRVGWVLFSHGDGMCVVRVLTAARLRQHGDMGVCVGWVLISNGDMGACWLGARQQRNMGVCLLGADQQWRHGCVLVCC